MSSKGNLKSYEFDVLIEGITREQAEVILNCILGIVDAVGAQMAGGFREADDGEEED